MYQSLIKSCADFHLYVFAFDDTTYQFLKNENYPKLTVISLNDFEDSELLSVKEGRTAAEYCWTCTPSTIRYCINRFDLKHCVYLDADMYFYSDPEILFQEWGTRSILITSHRYTLKYDQSHLSGKYCVQFVGFKNDEDGIMVLNWWRKACIEWCYNRIEEGKFGDQKYLDDWPARFTSICDLQYLGGGVAPWNVQQYDLKLFKKKWIGVEKETGKTFNLVFYHFHGLKLYNDGITSLSGDYDLNNREVRRIYLNYLIELERTALVIQAKLPEINVRGILGNALIYPESRIKKIIRKLKGFFGGYSGLPESVQNIIRFSYSEFRNR